MACFQPLFRYNGVMPSQLSGIFQTAAGPLRWLVQSDDAAFQSASDAPLAWLNADEARFWQALKTDKRRRDWALGRRAAKELLAKFILDETSQSVTYEQIVILPHADGWPIVTLPTLGAEAPAVTLSISHSHGRAFCAAIRGRDLLLGADIEQIERRSTAFVEEYFTPLERRYLAAAPEEQVDTLANAIWSGKEAALKAIRRGLTEDTRIVSCLPHPAMIADPEWSPMRIVWSEERLARPMPALTGHWRHSNNSVLTLAYAA